EPASVGNEAGPLDVLVTARRTGVSRLVRPKTRPCGVRYQAVFLLHLRLAVAARLRKDHPAGQTPPPGDTDPAAGPAPRFLVTLSRPAASIERIVRLSQAIPP